LNASKSIAPATLLSLVLGCSHPIQIVGEGDVLSASGTRNCYYEDYLAGAASCSENLVVHQYDETYYAVPRDGWEFEQWLNYSHCANTGNACAFNVPAAAVKTGWRQTVPPLVAVFARSAPPPPEPVAIYSYQLDAAGGLLNPQPLEGAHLQRKSVYFSFTGEYSKATFWCCNVTEGDEPHMPAVTDDTAPFVLRVDTGALSDDDGLQREFYAELFDSNGDDTGHYAYWTLEPPPASPLIFDDGELHTVDYTILPEVEVAGFSTLSLIDGSDLSKVSVLLGAFKMDGGQLDDLVVSDNNVRPNFEINGGGLGSIKIDNGSGTINGGSVGRIDTHDRCGMTITGGEIGPIHLDGCIVSITGGTFLETIEIDTESHLTVSGGQFGTGFVMYPDLGHGNELIFSGDLELTVLDYGRGYATFGIAGTLSDGSHLSQTIDALCAPGATDEDPCPGVRISVSP
jgi:hypothetical protein